MATDERPMYFLVDYSAPAGVAPPRDAVSVVECSQCLALIRKARLAGHIEAAHPDGGEG